MASRSQVKAGEAFIELGIKSRIDAGMKKAAADLKRRGAGIAKIGAVLSAASASVLAPLAAATKAFASYGDVLDKTAARTSASVEALSALGFGAEQSGTDLATVEKGLFGLSRALFDLERGSTELQPAFEKMGLSLQDLRGLGVEEQLAKVADGLMSISDESTRGAVAQQLFGKSGRMLLPLLAKGAAGLAEFRKEAQSLGIILSEDDTAAAAEATDAMNRFRRVVHGVVIQVGAALAPALTDISNKFAKVLSSAVEFIRENRHIVRVVAISAAAVGVAGAALVTLGGALALAGVAISGFTAALGLAGTMIGVVFSPLGAVLAVVAAAVGVVTVAVGAFVSVALIAAKKTGLLSEALDNARMILKNLWDTAKKAFGGISDAIAMGDWALAFDIAWAGVKVAFFRGIEDVMLAFGNMWPEMKKTAQEFFLWHVRAAADSFKAVAKIVARPFNAPKILSSFLAGLESKNKGGGIAGWMTNQRMVAEEEEETLVGIAESARDKIADISADATTASGGPGARDPGQSREEMEAQARLADLFKQKANAIALEIIALEKGEMAADRLRLAEEGLTKSQILQIEMLKRKKQALIDLEKKTKELQERQQELQEQQKQARAEKQEKRQDKRIDAIFERAESLAGGGVSPDEIFRRVMAQIQADQQAGTIGGDAAEQARGTARSNLKARIDTLRREGQALADALRTPAEVLNDKLADVSRLQDAGAIDEQTALRAEDKARKEFADTQKDLDTDAQRAGPGATFSAFAASVTGAGTNIGQRQLDEQKRMSKSLNRIDKNTKNKTAAFA